MKQIKYEFNSKQKEIIERHIKKWHEGVKKEQEIREAKKPKIIEPNKLKRKTLKQIKQ